MSICRFMELGTRFAAERGNRLGRRQLNPADFGDLATAGYLDLTIPAAQGGLWRSPRETGRTICAALRAVAKGDSSVALVAAMHPAVLSYWLAAPEPVQDCPDFAGQLQCLIETVRSGSWWGTITSEPASGGDLAQTRATAERDNGKLSYLLSGDKHFGSGSGVTDYMVTTAIPDGENKPDWFFVRTGGVAWDGSRGLMLLAEWDGQGMSATQSHAFRFSRFPATRIAWPGHLNEIASICGPLVGCLFTSVIIGIVDAAIDTARGQLVQRPSLKAYEQIEWERAQIDAWLAVQAFEGMLRSLESGGDARRDVLQGKTAIAELAENCLTRLCRVIGGGTLHRRSPFGHWQQDVRALGILRPPWPLAFEQLISDSKSSASS
jgi:alkylation response protein AidB-like acyl-CoA dehydrogenase